MRDRNAYFTVEAALQNSDAAAPVHLLENKIVIDMTGSRTLRFHI